MGKIGDEELREIMEALAPLERFWGRALAEVEEVLTGLREEGASKTVGMRPEAIEESFAAAIAEHEAIVRELVGRVSRLGEEALIGHRARLAEEEAYLRAREVEGEELMERMRLQYAGARIQKK